jgi:hypothetical protein
MHKWQLLASIFVLLVVSVEAKAGDKEDVLAHMAEFYSALNAADTDPSHVDAIPFTKHTSYYSNGELLATTDPVKIKAYLKGQVAAGAKIDIQPSHQNADVYGNAAVFTCYESRNIKRPQGPIKETIRNTMVLVKQKGEWKVVHSHQSLLTPVNPE